MVNVEEIGKDTGQNLSRRSGRQVPVLKPLILAAEDFLAIAPGQDFSLMERIEKNIVIAGEKVAGQVDALDRNAGMVADEHVNQREGDRDAFALIEHAGQNGVALGVVVTCIADENEFAGEKVRHDLDLLPAVRGAA